MQNNNSFSINVNFEELLFLIILSVLIFGVPQFILNSSELGCIISSGNYMINNLTISPPFSAVFTSVSDFYINANWLSDIILAYIFKIGGYQSILVISSVIIAVSFALLYRFMAIKNPNWLVCVVLLVAGLLACTNSIEVNNRLFSFPLILILVYLLDRILKQKEVSQNQYLYLGFLFILWANLNTDFVFGLLIMMIYLISLFIKFKYNKVDFQSNLFKSFIRLFILSILVCLLNPNGIYLFSSLFSFYLSGLYKVSGYLASPNFHTALSFKIFELFILLLIFLAAFSKYKPSLEKTVLIVVFLFLSLYSAVNIPFFIFVSLPVLAEIINNTDLSFGINFIENLFNKTNYQISYNKPITSIAIVFMILIVSLSTNFINTKPLLANQFPQRAIDYIKANNIQGRVFNPYGWGCYISNNLSCRVFIDERLYETTFSTVGDYSTIINIYKNYQETLDKHKIDWVIIPSSRSLSLLLKTNGRWQKVYEDKRSCIYTRNKEKE